MSRGLRYVQLLVSVAVGILVVGVLVRLFENGLIFFPTRYPDGVWDAAAFGLEVEDVWFPAADGTRLHGWWIPASVTGRPDTVREAPSRSPARRGSTAAGGLPPPVVVFDGSGHRYVEGSAEGRPLLVWLHGNAGNLTYRAEHAAVLAANGLDVFLFDYRGYGRSEGGPSEAGLYSDAEGAYRFLTEERGVDARRIVLYGRSVGAAPAAWLARRVSHAGIILVSPFPSAASMARRMFFGLPMHWFARSRFPVGEWAAQRRTPLLVVHGEADDIVPVALGRRVFEAAAEPKRFVGLPGAGHNDVLATGGRAYLEAVVGFAFDVVEAAGGAVE